MINNLSQEFLLFVTSVSGIGISYLIALIWKYHIAKMDALKLVTFKNVEGELDALENLVAKLDDRIQSRIAELEIIKHNQKETDPIKKKLTIIKQIQNVSGVYRLKMDAIPDFMNELQKESQDIFSSDSDSIKNKIINYIDEEN